MQTNQQVNIPMATVDIKTALPVKNQSSCWSPRKVFTSAAIFLTVLCTLLLVIRLNLNHQARQKPNIIEIISGDKIKMNDITVLQTIQNDVDTIVFELDFKFHLYDFNDKTVLMSICKPESTKCFIVFYEKCGLLRRCIAIDFFGTRIETDTIYKMDEYFDLKTIRIPIKFQHGCVFNTNTAYCQIDFPYFKTMYTKFYKSDLVENLYLIV